MGMGIAPDRRAPPPASVFVAARGDRRLYARMESPIGELLLLGDGEAVTGLHMQAGPSAIALPAEARADPAALRRARSELDEYFRGERLSFDLPLAPTGTPFQLRVWAALLAIPFGQTASYGEIARRIGRPAGARAVGLANGKNPIAVIVPCHRVIGASGDLTGYGGGLERKRWLLAHESAQRRLPG